VKCNDKPNVFVFIEEWEDQAALDSHNDQEFKKSASSQLGAYVDKVNLRKFSLACDRKH